MIGRLPSTKALRAFEAAARLGSLSAAAQYLSLTPSALSRRIQSLEEELGQALFYRDSKGVVLTEAGRAYAERLHKVFSDLAEATDAARVNMPQRIRLLLPGLFAILVMNHLKDFEAKRPGVEIALDIYSKEPGVDPRIGDNDILIYYSDRKSVAYDSVSLTPLGGYCMPVCTPDYLPKVPLSDPAELAQFTWIRITGHPDLWEHWCVAAGIPGMQPKNFFDVNSAVMARNAAQRGLGIWLSGGIRPYSVYDGLNDRLVLAHPFHAFFPNHSYYLAYRPESANNPLIAEFTEWIHNALIPKKIRLPQD